MKYERDGFDPAERAVINRFLKKYPLEYAGKLVRSAEDVQKQWEDRAVRRARVKREVAMCERYTESMQGGGNKPYVYISAACTLTEGTGIGHPREVYATEEEWQEYMEWMELLLALGAGGVETRKKCLELLREPSANAGTVTE